MDIPTDETIIKFPAVKRPEPTAPLSIAKTTYGRGECKHVNVVVDPKLSEVTCATCKVKLNPIWVLTQYAEEDWRLWDRWLALRAQCKLLEARVRTACQHCGKQTRINSHFSYHDMLVAKDEIEKEERGR